MRQQKRQILTDLLFLIIFVAVMSLYRLPPAAMLYPLLLCAAVGLASMGIGGYRTYRRYVSLQKILEAVGLDLEQEFLPGKKAAGNGQKTIQEDCAWELLQEILEGREKNAWKKGTGRAIYTRRW